MRTREILLAQTQELSFGVIVVGVKNLADDLGVALLMKALLPHIYQICEEINRRFCQELRNSGVSEEEIGKMSILWEECAGR